MKAVRRLKSQRSCYCSELSRAWILSGHHRSSSSDDMVGLGQSGKVLFLLFLVILLIYLLLGIVHFNIFNIGNPPSEGKESTLIRHLFSAKHENNTVLHTEPKLVQTNKSHDKAKLLMVIPLQSSHLVKLWNKNRTPESDINSDIIKNQTRFARSLSERTPIERKYNLSTIKSLYHHNSVSISNISIMTHRYNVLHSDSKHITKRRHVRKIHSKAHVIQERINSTTESVNTQNVSLNSKLTTNKTEGNDEEYLFDPTFHVMRRRHAFEQDSKAPPSNTPHRRSSYQPTPASVFPQDNKTMTITTSTDSSYFNNSSGHINDLIPSDSSSTSTTKVPAVVNVYSRHALTPGRLVGLILPMACAVVGVLLFVILAKCNIRLNCCEDDGCFVRFLDLCNDEWCLDPQRLRIEDNYVRMESNVAYSTTNNDKA